MSNRAEVPNDWIERVEQRVKDLLAKEQFAATVFAARGVPPDDHVGRPALIGITPTSDHRQREFEIRPPTSGDDSNLNEEAGRILRDLNWMIENPANKPGYVTDFDPLDPPRE